MLKKLNFLNKITFENRYKQAKEGLFKSQIKHTISHFKLTASQLVRRSLGEGGRLSNHLTENTFEKWYTLKLKNHKWSGAIFHFLRATQRD